VAPSRTSTFGLTAASSPSSHGRQAVIGLVRLLVDPALPSRLPLEVLDRVRDVGRRPVDPRGLEGLVEEAAGRADEWLASLVLLVAGLLAHEHHLGRSRPFSEDGLRRRLPERAGLAARGRLAEGTERRHAICMAHLGLI